MFLLCNGLLVFVGITRSLSAESRPSSSVDESSNNVKDGSQSVYSMVEAKVTVLVSEQDEDKVKDINFEEGKGSSILILEQGKEPKEESRLFDEEDEEKDNNTEMVDEEEVLEEASWVLNTDELNKRFDDFIRRMKEDLRIEAQRQFVMA